MSVRYSGRNVTQDKSDHSSCVQSKEYDLVKMNLSV